MNTSKTGAKKTETETVRTRKSRKSPQPTTEPTAVLTPPLPSPEVSVPNPVLVATAAATPVTPPGDLPPAVGAPPPRAGWEPTPKKKRGPKGQRPKGAQSANANAVAKELTGSPTYAEDFGSHAPAAAQVAYVVTNASKWRELWLGAKKFFVYASEQRALWEDDALVQMNALKVPFTYAASRDAKLAEKYSATSKYLATGTVIAQRAVVSRKANANARTKAGKAKAGAATEVAATPSPSPASPAPEAPTATVATGK